MLEKVKLIYLIQLPLYIDNNVTSVVKDFFNFDFEHIHCIMDIGNPLFSTKITNGVLQCYYGCSNQEVRRSRHLLPYPEDCPS